MKIIIAFLLFVFSLNISYSQSHKSILKYLVVDAENMHQECSTFLFAKVETDKKGCVDTVKFITGGNTLFAQNIKAGFLNLKIKKERISKKSLIIFFVYQNITEGEGFDASKCPKDITDYPLFAKEEQTECIFIGPVVIMSGIR